MVSSGNWRIEFDFISRIFIFFVHNLIHALYLYSMGDWMFKDDKIYSVFFLCMWSFYCFWNKQFVSLIKFQFNLIEAIKF